MIGKLTGRLDSTHESGCILDVNGVGYLLSCSRKTLDALSARDALGDRLLILHQGLAETFANFQPDEAAVENTYVARNPESALKLGQARGVVMLAPRLAGLPVAEYGAMEVKRAVVGNGHAAKEQVQAMVRHLLPGVAFRRADAADALAIAICHAHHRQTKKMLAKGYATA